MTKRHDTSAPSWRLCLKTWAFVLVVILTNTLGNFALTRGMRHLQRDLLASPLGYIAAVFSPWVALGMGLLIVWLLTRMTLLTWADLSYVLPVTSPGYAIAALMGRFFLDEHVSPKRWVGTLLIVAGAAVVGKTSTRTSRSTPARAQEEVAP